MPAPDRNPLAATGRLLVDGTNLLHAMSRSTGAAPPAALIGRLRGAIPGRIVIELVFDGPAEPGLRGERIASGVSVRYSGARTADTVILALVDEVRKAGDATDTGALLVVTDDRDLRYEARLRGARTAGAKWLLRKVLPARVARSATRGHRGLSRDRAGAPALVPARRAAAPASRVPATPAASRARTIATRDGRAGTPAGAPPRSAATRRKRPAEAVLVGCRRDTP
jgi:hypothetical protein